MSHRPRPLPGDRAAFETLIRQVQHSAGEALQPLASETHWLDVDGCRYPVRCLEGLQRKIDSDANQRRDADAGRPANPFLPYEHALYVCHVAPRHVCLLNKFPVLDDHLLLITEHFEPQTQLLNGDDFSALLSCLALVDGLGFYNGGGLAGATQGHKHLQFLPLSALGGSLPIAPLLTDLVFDGELGHSPHLPFCHAVARLPSAWLAAPQRAGVAFARVYQQLLQAVGFALEGAAENAEQPGPYNLLATRELIWLVPRSSAGTGELCFNALGYAGALMVRHTTALEALRTSGPLGALAAAAQPPHREDTPT